MSTIEIFGRVLLVMALAIFAVYQAREARDWHRDAMRMKFSSTKASRRSDMRAFSHGLVALLDVALVITLPIQWLVA